MRRSFTIRVFCIHFLVLALPLLVDSFLFFQNFYDEAIEHARSNLREEVYFRVLTLGEIQPVYPEILKDLIYLLDLNQEKIDPKKVDQTLKGLSDLEGGSNFYILGLPKEGSNEFPVIASSNEATEGHVVMSYLEMHKILEQGEGGFVRFGTKSDRLLLFVGESIVFEKLPVGLIVSVSDIQDGVEKILKPDKHPHIDFVLLNQDNIALASSMPSLVGQYVGALTPKRRKELIETNQLGDIKLANKPVEQLKSAPHGFVDFEFEGNAYIAKRMNVPNMDMALVAFSAKKQFFAKAVNHFILIYITYAVILIVGAILAFLLAHWVSRPLRQLSHVMGEANEGNLEARFHAQPFGFEINLLGSMFNETLNVLLKNMKLAEEERVQRETYQHEVNIGREVQQNLLMTDFPTVNDATIAAIYREATEVGGDFYCIEKKEENLWFAIGDASGKGISSCLFALSARSLMRSYASLYEDVGDILAHTNSAFLEDAGDTGMFVTSLMGMYYPEKKELVYYSCGHVPGIVRKKNGKLVTLEHSGMALGLLESHGYQSNSLQLEHGDLVIFYTKGLVEGVNSRHQYFSERRVRELLQHRKWQTADAAVGGLQEELATFIGSTPQEHEVVIIALAIT